MSHVTLMIPCMLFIKRSRFASLSRFKFHFPLVAGGWQTLSSSFRRIERVIFSAWTCRRNWKLGLVTTQLKVKTIQSFENSSSDPIHYPIKYTLISSSHWCHVKSKDEKFLFFFQDRVASEIKLLVEQRHIEKLDKCTTDCFIAPIVLTAKKDVTIKLALNAKPMNAQIWKNKYQMPNFHVMQRLDVEGWALKLSKCKFSVNQLTWLGYDINENGYSPKISKIEAIQSLKPPRTLKQLPSFMGTLNHLQRLIPDLHTNTVLFRASLKACNKQSFLWGEDQNIAFHDIINMIAKIPSLYHFDSSA